MGKLNFHLFLFRLFIIGILLLVLLYSVLHKKERVEGFTNNSPRILNLVLYSKDNGGPYDKMQKITQKYYNTFSNVDTFYYCYSPDLETNYKVKDNILYIKGSETYIHGILKNTISAFEYFKDQLSNYDYVIRSNISTIVRFDLLSDYLKKKINPVQYACALCFRGDVKYSSGTTITLSSSVVSTIIENKEKIDYSIIDDMSIGKFIMKNMPDVKMDELFPDIPNNGFYMIPDLSADKEKIKNFMKGKEIVFFRNRDANENRLLDANQMDLIVDILLDLKP